MDLSKDRLIFQVGDLANSPTVGSYLVDAAGNLLTSTLISGKQSLDVNVTNPIPLAVDLNGIYNVSTNPTPDNVGMILFSRAASPALSDQIQTPTSATAASDAVVAANVHGADVNSFGMWYNGTTWDRARSISSRMATFGNPNTAILNTAATVTTSAALLVASPLANRMQVQIQNKGTKSIFIGTTGVTSANGLEVAAGNTESLDAGAGVAIYAIAASGSQDVRVLELA